jgi:histidinol-phosphate aminotransferase
MESEQMKALWKKSLDSVTPYKPGKPIDEVKRELGLDRVYKLASNENPYGPSAKVMEAIIAAAGEINRYPDGGCFHLRKILSEKLSVHEDKIVFGNGSDELIILALKAFVRPGEEVILSHPTFLVYKIASELAEAEVVTVPVKDFKYDLEGMLSKITDNTRMIFIANPENPTGTYINSQELEGFMEKVPRHVVVFIDEAYYEFAKGGDFPETLGMTEIEGRNLIVSRTFSKVYGLAGLRLGYTVARKDLSMAINKVREPFNVNSIAQAAAIAALNDDEFFNRSLELVKKEKAKICKALETMDVDFVPSKTNFVLIDTKRDSREIFKILLKEGVIVREMSSWSLSGFVRVSVGLPNENDLFIETFGKALKLVPRG